MKSKLVALVSDRFCRNASKSCGFLRTPRFLVLPFNSAHSVGALYQRDERVDSCFVWVQSRILFAVPISFVVGDAVGSSCRQGAWSKSNTA